MDWQVIASLALTGIGNTLILAMTAILSAGLALRLSTLAQPRAQRHKQPKQTSTTPQG